MEVELLLDEGSSRIMTEELRNSLGPPTMGDARGVAAVPEKEGSSSPAPTTPWRGRIVSLGASAKRRSLATSGGQTLRSLSEDAATLTSPPPSSSGDGGGGVQAGQILLLRQSTAEASDLRRQVAALSAELERLKRERDDAEAARAAAVSSTVATRGQQVDDERIEALRQELEAAQVRESELRSDWEADRRAMEEDMAELAAVAAATAAAVTSSSGPIPKLDPVIEAATQSVAMEQAVHPRLLLTASESAGASLQAGSTFAELELLARREREESRFAIATLQAVARGLDGWRSLLS